MLVSDLDSSFPFYHCGRIPSLLCCTEDPLVSLLSTPVSVNGSPLLQGAMAGLAFSLVVNTWMVIGRYVVSGKQPVRLPLSLDGCLDQGAATALNATLGLLANATVDAASAAAPSKPESVS